MVCLVTCGCFPRKTSGPTRSLFRPSACPRFDASLPIPVSGGFGVWTVLAPRAALSDGSAAMREAYWWTPKRGGQHCSNPMRLHPERVHVLPYVAPPYMRADTSPPGFGERYRLPENFIFYPAQFWEHKNHLRLLKALVMLGSAFSRLDLVSRVRQRMPTASDTGGDRQTRPCRSCIDYGLCPGRRRAGVLSACTCIGDADFLRADQHPSIEAMAVGCPMAVSNIYAMPEQVGRCRAAVRSGIGRRDRRCDPPTRFRWCHCAAAGLRRKDAGGPMGTVAVQRAVGAIIETILRV